jgi:CheY-like chemotaxis protein
VLVVDDEPAVRLVITDVLQEMGYQALEAADGPTGLRVLETEPGVDLLVTDVGLPGGLNGLQTADAARVMRPGLKVLLVTGYAGNAAIGASRLPEGMQILTKPFAADALAIKVRAMLEA